MTKIGNIETNPLGGGPSGTPVGNLTNLPASRHSGCYQSSQTVGGSAHHRSHHPAVRAGQATPGTQLRVRRGPTCVCGPGRTGVALIHRNSRRYLASHRPSGGGGGWVGGNYCLVNMRELPPRTEASIDGRAQRASRRRLEVGRRQARRTGWSWIWLGRPSGGR